MPSISAARVLLLRVCSSVNRIRRRSASSTVVPGASVTVGSVCSLRLTAAVSDLSWEDFVEFATAFDKAESVRDCLATEIADSLRVVGDAGVQDLQRHLALEREVADAPYVTVRAASELGEQLVVVAHRLAQSDVGVIVGAPHRLVIAAHEQRARCTAPVRARALEIAQHRRDGGISACGIFRQRARQYRGESFGRLRAQERHWRDVDPGHPGHPGRPATPGQRSRAA